MPESPKPEMMKPVLRPQRAYQGEVSGRMRLVLGVSLLLAVVLVVGLALDWRESHSAGALQSTSPPATQPMAPSTPGDAQPKTPPGDQ